MVLAPAQPAVLVGMIVLVPLFYVGLGAQHLWARPPTLAALEITNITLLLDIHQDNPNPSCQMSSSIALNVTIKAPKSVVARPLYATLSFTKVFAKGAELQSVSPKITSFRVGEECDIEDVKLNGRETKIRSVDVQALKRMMNDSGIWVEVARVFIVRETLWKHFGLPSAYTNLNFICKVFIKGGGAEFDVLDLTPRRHL